MNRQNIISAGKMMAIVVSLLGAMFCGAALIPLIGDGLANVDVHQWIDTPQRGLFGVAPLWNILFGAMIIVCGLVMNPSFGRAERRSGFATLALVAALITLILGLLAVIFVYRNPFAWMTAIVGMAVSVDAICLVIVLKK
jgi:hypothetical protein